MEVDLCIFYVVPFSVTVEKYSWSACGKKVAFYNTEG